ncbi:MAG: hypothetical protein WBR13_08845 [Allosphingosinicella sp.]
MTDVLGLHPVIGQLTRCGLKAEGLRVEFEPVVQGDVVTVTAGAGADASMFICIRHASWGEADIIFEEERLGNLYRDFEHSVNSAEGRAQARAWLAERGRLGDLPVFAEDEPASSIVEKVERYCAIEPGTALELHGHFIALKPELLCPPALTDFEFLMNVMDAIDLQKHGLSFGFIGNAAVESNEN